MLGLKPFIRGIRVKFDRAVSLLQDIRANPDDLRALDELQKLLVATILHAEETISFIKAKVEKTNGELRKGRPPRERAQVLRKRVAQLSSRIDLYKEAIYFCRCFGDAVAFSFLDKHAIKQAFYKTENVAPKEAAGAMGGKIGLAGEIMFLQEVTEKGIPAILTDLTNSLRYGDVCLMSGNDPAFVEVKTGRLGDRGRKQTADILRLHDFYETDAADGLRGFEQVRRVEHPVPEITYTAEFNQCIESAYETGSAIANPEPGLYYLAITDEETELSDLLARMQLTEPLIYFMNERKNLHEWAPYTPFILTIENPEHVWGFIRGHLIVTILLDIPVLRAAVARDGYTVSWTHGDDYPLKITNEATDGVGGISQHFIDRIAYECVSPRWIAAVQTAAMERQEREVYADDSRGDPASGGPGSRKPGPA